MTSSQQPDDCFFRKLWNSVHSFLKNKCTRDKHNENIICDSCPGDYVPDLSEESDMELAVEHPDYLDCSTAATEPESVIREDIQIVPLTGELESAAEPKNEGSRESEHDAVIVQANTAEPDSQRQMTHEPETSVPPPKTDTLLDNRPFVKLTENIVRLGDDIARHLPTLPPEAEEFAKYVSARLDEMLLCCGLDPIEEEHLFNIVRHQAVPAKNVPNGTPIASTLSPGLILEERVFRRARVEIKNE